MHLTAFLRSGLQSAITGGRRYHVWMGILTVFMLLGAWAYSIQLREGLGVTGLSDHVSWGLYISNFTFLVGLAAAAMMLVLPAYVFDDVDFGKAVLIVPFAILIAGAIWTYAAWSGARSESGGRREAAEGLRVWCQAVATAAASSGSRLAPKGARAASKGEASFAVSAAAP